VNKSLELLVPAVHELLAQYRSSGTTETDNLPTFLSCLSLEQYHAAEERFTQELVSFTKKQFFEVSLLPLLLYMVRLFVCPRAVVDVGQIMKSPVGI